MSERHRLEAEFMQRVYDAACDLHEAGLGNQEIFRAMASSFVTCAVVAQLPPDGEEELLRLMDRWMRAAFRRRVSLEILLEQEGFGE